MNVNVQSWANRYVAVMNRQMREVEGVTAGTTIIQSMKAAYDEYKRFMDMFLVLPESTQRDLSLAFVRIHIAELTARIINLLETDGDNNGNK